MKIIEYVDKESGRAAYKLKAETQEDCAVLGRMRADLFGYSPFSTGGVESKILEGISGEFITEAMLITKREVKKRKGNKKDS